MVVREQLAGCTFLRGLHLQTRRDPQRTAVCSRCQEFSKASFSMCNGVSCMYSSQLSNAHADSCEYQRCDGGLVTYRLATCYIKPKVHGCLGSREPVFRNLNILCMRRWVPQGTGCRVPQLVFSFLDCTDIRTNGPMSRGYHIACL